MSMGITTLVEDRRNALARLAGKLDALSPLGTMRRGFAVPLSLQGALLRGVADFRAGESFLLRVVDGRIRAETHEIESDEVDRDG